MAMIVQSKSVELQVKGYYQKQTYRNRTSIYGANGTLSLVIPIKKNKTKERLQDQKAEISFEEPWQQNHWKSFVTAYRSSPFFEFYEDELKAIFFNKTKLLVEFNIALLKMLFDWLDIEKSINISSETPEYNRRANDLISAKKECSIGLPNYPQVFNSKLGFIPNLSVLDLIFNLGPESIDYLLRVNVTSIRE